MTTSTFIYDVVENGATGLLALANSEEQFSYIAENLFQIPSDEVTVDDIIRIARSKEEFDILAKMMCILPLELDEVKEAMELTLA